MPYLPYLLPGISLCNRYLSQFGQGFWGVHSLLKNGSRMWSQATGTWAIWGSFTHWWKWTKPKEFPRHRKQRRLIPLNRDTQLKTLYLREAFEKKKVSQTIKPVKKPFYKPIKETLFSSQSHWCHCPPAGAHFLQISNPRCCGCMAEEARKWVIGQVHVRHRITWRWFDQLARRNPEVWPCLMGIYEA